MATLQEKREACFMSEFHLHRYVDKKETIATIVAKDYLKGTDIGLQVGDLILVTGSDETGLYNVKKYDKSGAELELVVLKSA